jgi:hypothetical protein
MQLLKIIKLDKYTLVGWTNKAFKMSLSKKNIKNGFKIIEACSFNPNAMDMKRPNQVMYTFQQHLGQHINILYEDRWFWLSN